MLEIRSFDGTPEELSDFIVSSWKQQYLGKMAVPLWTPDYLRWQLRLDEAGSREHLIAAYHGSQIAGVVCYFPMKFALNGEEIPGSQASWLSVSPEFRKQGAASSLIEGSRARHRETGLRFQLGYAYYGHRTSGAPRFWKSTQQSTTDVVRDAGFWVRVLDPSTAGKWNYNPLQRWMTRITAPFCGAPRVRSIPGLTIRPAREADLDRCLELADDATSDCALRLIWNRDTMARHLGLRGYGEALVAEIDGVVQGCMTFHPLTILGQCEATFGILDLVLVSRLSKPARSVLLNSTLARMHALGMACALKLRAGDYPSGMFMEVGWLPRPADSHVLVTWADERVAMPHNRKIHALWR